MTKPETRLQRKIRKAIKEKYPGSIVVKFSGGRFSKAGVSDLLCCIRGSFISIEVKTPSKEPTELQWEFIARVIRAGGAAGYVTSPQQALNLIKEGLNGPRNICSREERMRRVREVAGSRITQKKVTQR